MDRRSFFTLVGAAGLSPLVGCTGRDLATPTPDQFGPELAKFRHYIVPEGIEPALDFRPLRQPKP
jgi:hypothetical protein